MTSDYQHADDTTNYMCAPTGNEIPANLNKCKKMRTSFPLVIVVVFTSRSRDVPTGDGIASL